MNDFVKGAIVGSVLSSGSSEKALGVIMLGSGGASVGSTDFNAKANPMKYESGTISDIRSNPYHPDQTLIMTNGVGLSNIKIVLNMTPDKFFDTLQRQNGYVQINKNDKGNYTLVPSPTGADPSVTITPTPAAKQ